MQKNLKIKLWYLFYVNRKQFIWIYLILSNLIILGGIWSYYYNPVLDDKVSKITKFYFNNDVIFWFIFLLYTIIEALFFWNKFNKEHIKIINEQKTELEQQKEEIISQKEELASQRDAAVLQTIKIEKQNKLITSSIQYAERIQQAVLPIKSELDNIFENFIIFKPRDIVSGDFYWFRNIETLNNKLSIIAVADCTGHGVPGAFLSMLGISILNEIVGVREIILPDEILNTLRSEIKKSLHQMEENVEQQDGMDIALSVINKNEKTISFAGANNPLYLCTNKINNISSNNKKIKIFTGEKNNYLIEIKPDRMPIGIYTHEHVFSCSNIKFNKNDTIYMFSDGYIDQFGGKKNQKFMSKNFKQLILNNSNFSLLKQKNILENTLKNWQGNNEQIDDILVVGIKL